MMLFYFLRFNIHYIFNTKYTLYYNHVEQNKGIDPGLPDTRKD